MTILRRPYLSCREVGLLFVLLGSPPTLDAQEGDLVRGCMDDANQGVVKGQVINDSTGLPEPGHGLWLRSSEVCFSLTDSTASFEFRNVPNGAYELFVADLKLRNFQPIPVTVAADTVYIEVRVQPYDLVADCEAMTECGVLLNPTAAGELGPDRNRLLETGFRTAIAVSLAKGGVPSDWVPCVEGATADILDALRRRIPEVVPAGGCEMREAPGGVPDKLMVHVASGRSAYVVGFKLTESSDEAASGWVSLSVAPLWGSGWACTYGRTAEGWWLKACELRVQS